MRSHFVVGVVLGVFFVAGAVGTAVSVNLPARSQAWTGNAALAVGVLVTVASLMVRATPLYVVGSAVAGLGFGAAFRFAVHALGQAAPAAARGQVFASMYVVSYLAFSVPALAAGLAVGRFGLEPTVVAYGALDVALVLVAMVVGGVRARRQDQGSELLEGARLDARPGA